MRILVLAFTVMKKLLLFCFIGMLPLWLFATHNRAGEITYRHINGLEFEITVTTYTDPTSVAADRCELEVKFGDGDYDTIPRINNPGPCTPSISCDCQGRVLIASILKENVYQTRHTYRGPGVFEVSVEDPNRVEGIQNIPGSVNIPFFIRSTINISPLVGYNSSSILLYPPVDDGCVGQPYYHNPGAYDPDQDSLAYSLVKCRGTNGAIVPNYVFPNSLGGGSLSIDPRTGTLTWDSPTTAGFFNLCILITEYRKVPGSNKSVVVGEVLRDMQIAIDRCINAPPEFIPIEDVCVNAGDKVSQLVVAFDSLGQSIALSAVGEPFEVDSPAVFPQPFASLDTVRNLFTWDTECSHIRLAPYKVDFKAIDNYPFGALANFESFFITIVGPAPQNPQALAEKNTIALSWEPSTCSNAQGYKVYRRIDSSSFDPDFCEIGIPSTYGFIEIANIAGAGNTAYFDDDGGNGLVHGQVYCYRIVAYYDDGVEGYSSTEVCAELAKDAPVLTHVTVVETDDSEGVDSLRWTHPIDIDTSVEFPGPYKYMIYGSDGNVSPDFYIGETTVANRISELDSSFEVRQLNNVDFPQNFKIVLESAGEPVGNTTAASSVFLSILPRDNALDLIWNHNVPWTNLEYVVFKLLDDTFRVIDTTKLRSFTDTGLTNEKEYTYYVRSIGRYSTEGFPEPIINNSQIASGIPADTVRPCAPIPTIQSDCDLGRNSLLWPKSNLECANDVVSYNIYWTAVVGEEYRLLRSLPSSLDTSFVFDNLESVAGCYVVTAVDSFSNESDFSAQLCVDNCPVYELPNVFTPGGDGFNDLFMPGPYRYIESIDLVVYNRWGNLVFKTTDPDIRWNGTHYMSKKPLSSGVYFYECIVYEIRLNGIVPRRIRGNVSIINQDNISNPN